MDEIKNIRMLPSAQFEFVDNGVLLTIVDVMSNQIIERKVHEELTDALKIYRDMCKTVGKRILEVESKTESKEEL